MTKKILNLLLVLAATFSLASCNDDNGNDGPDMYIDFVTFVSQTDDGTVFTMQREAYTPLITYTSTQKFDTQKFDPKRGERLLLQYSIDSPRDPYTSGPIKLYGYREVINGEIIEGAASDYSNWRTAGVQQPAIWVTGPYLNFNMVTRYLNKLDYMKLVVDETTLDQKMPTVYCIIEPDDINVGNYQQVYASFDISYIWNNTKYDGFVLRLNNETGSDTMEFRNRETITPA